MKFTTAQIASLFQQAGLDPTNEDDVDAVIAALKVPTEAGVLQAAQAAASRKQAAGKVTTGIEDLNAAWENVQAKAKDAASQKGTASSKPSTAQEDFDLVFQAVQRNGHK
jgi:hypothetical protein